MKHTKEINAFSKKMKQLRKEKKLTQVELAGLCDVDVRTIKYLEAGKLNASLNLIISLAKAFEVSTRELF